MITLAELSNTDDYYQYCLLLEQLTSINPNNIKKEDFMNYLSIIKSNPYHKIIIAKLHNKIIGTITVLIEPKFIHNLSKIAHIEDVVVDKNYRSHGIGGLLVRKAIEISKQFQCYKIILDCSDKNIDFYSKFGFIKKELQMALYL
jgi:glucosamine-phosphate N-acetyltransferase